MEMALLLIALLLLLLEIAFKAPLSQPQLEIVEAGGNGCGSAVVEEEAVEFR